MLTGGVEGTFQKVLPPKPKYLPRGAYSDIKPACFLFTSISAPTILDMYGITETMTIYTRNHSVTLTGYMEVNEVWITHSPTHSLIY